MMSGRRCAARRRACSRSRATRRSTFWPQSRVWLSWPSSRRGEQSSTTSIAPASVARAGSGVGRREGGRLELAQPGFLGGVARHPPVPARGQADGAYLGPVRHHRPLELAVEEALDEAAQPAPEGRRRIAIGEGVLGQEERLARPRPQADEAEEEEVMELV